jgi:hypothetical protein
VATDLDKEKERLRQYLNPSIRGENTNTILEALATGSCHLIDNVCAVNDMLYITTARERYLDALLADRDVIRPDNVGLSDEVFRRLGIEVVNRKQVRDLIHKILETMYGVEFVRSIFRSTELEPYQLEDGDTLILEFDGEEPVTITFSTGQFANINAATAQEVSDAIIRGLRSAGRTGSAFAGDDGAGGFVNILSSSNGPSSTVRVLGGRAQNELKFPEIRQTTAETTTQWTVEVQPSGAVRLIWTGGPNPTVGRVKKGDYLNLYGDAFVDDNKGTFTITEVRGGLVGEAYVEYENINGFNETTIQADLEGVLFFNPKRALINSKKTFAAAFQTESQLLEVFIPATTKVVRRDRQGAAHIVESGASTEDNLGPYTFDLSKSFVVGQEECQNTITVDSSTERIINVDDASEIPDEEGFLVFGLGTSKEEGPVPYIARLSDNTILINPAYQFEQIHEPGTNISLITQNFAYDVAQDASDFPFYVTDMVSGRVYAEDLIDLVRATGIVLNVVILYPGDEGLAKWGRFRTSERYYVWGEDPDDGNLFDDDDINTRI